MTHESQAQRILRRLQQGPATSWELQQLGICCHTRRIFELRKQYEITSTERRVNGKRVVTYSLEGSHVQTTTQAEMESTTKSYSLPHSEGFTYKAKTETQVRRGQQELFGSAA